MDKNIILAFTGGLQSSVCLHWLVERRRANVTAVVVELGQMPATWELGEYAVDLGARGAHVEDCREEFISDYAFRALQASAVYEHNYLLSGALTRPLIAAVIVRMAREEGCKSVALGAISRSNDITRFTLNVEALAPELNIIGPDEIPPLQSREAAVEYAREHDIEPMEGLNPALSFDTNLWGSAISVNPDVGTWEALSEECYRSTNDPACAPEELEEVTITFQKGVPVALNGEDVPPHELVRRLNEKAGRLGIGRTEVVEDRLAGCKAREVYEAPGATVLMEAHRALEELTLDYATLRAKSRVGQCYAELVYGGNWFSDLRKALNAFVNVVQEKVTGKVKMQLYRGNARAIGRQSPNSLFDSEKARSLTLPGTDGNLTG
ncbi:MAG: argininosuccinate synthase [Planctomycetota bacterium]